MQNRLAEQRGLQKIRSCFRNYLIGGLLLVLLYAAWHSGFTPGSLAGAAWIWGDGFVMSGILLYLAVGASVLGRHSYFDWVFYGIYLSRFLFTHSRDEEYTNFFDFKKLRRRGDAPFWPGVLVATIWFLTGLILSMLYYLL
ncbi:hypothetical protein H8S23_04310 [Anaerofilum sp. BX8]|uniref:DUF3899 domain-containing protein n=1 Tax=Anaerofilum hominis TaxID=2763016 RepID=A0A923I5J5_9FIRM|nr:hypothetical protein [Anaerofilum hominis]MBC5580720.1 hypothetical protein [Anaerofilum hominis]